MNSVLNDFWVVESILSPKREVFLFRHSGTEVRVGIKNGRIINWSRELSIYEILFIEKYFVDLPLNTMTDEN